MSNVNRQAATIKWQRVGPTGTGNGTGTTTNWPTNVNGGPGQGSVRGNVRGMGNRQFKSSSKSGNQTPGNQFSVVTFNVVTHRQLQREAITKLVNKCVVNQQINRPQRNVAVVNVTTNRTGQRNPTNEPGKGITKANAGSTTYPNGNRNVHHRGCNQPTANVTNQINNVTGM